MLIERYRRKRKMFRIPKISSLAEAFEFFETSYKESFPQDQDGFTWTEAITKARKAVQVKDFEWENIQRTLRQYEGHRYGGIEVTKVDTYPILKLAIAIREKMYTTWN